MVNRAFLSKINGVLINTSRGSVVDEHALHESLNKNIETAILDVWEHEPQIDRDLAKKVLGTPHIAGYSFDGKVNGTQMMYDAVCRFFGIEPTWKAYDVVPPGKHITCSGQNDEDIVRDAVFQVYDIGKDFDIFQKNMAEFDRLRKEYPVRREFPTTVVTFEGSGSPVKKLRGLGFNVIHKPKS
jgi:erythronate-4-phosphate dehydrogenase